MAMQLFKHNQSAYEAVVTMLAETGKAAVIHPTGTGKSFIGFKLCEDNPDKTICWLSPSDYIFRTQLENLKEESPETTLDNVKYFTYARLMNMTEQELSDIKPDYIILDEFHRAGAEFWGEGVKNLLSAYPDVKLLGLSATAIRYLDNQRNMADELFDGNIASEMTLGEAIVRGILNPPKYVLSIFSYQESLAKYELRVQKTQSKAVRDKAEKYIEALRRALDKAEKNVINLLDSLNDELNKGSIKYEEIPLIIFRVRNIEQFKHFSSMLKPEHIHLVTAFNFPKFNMESGEAYFEHLEKLNTQFGEIIYGMPILESKEMAYLETRIPQLMAVKEILDRHKNLVLNVRVGGTDWSSVFGMRRGINYTIYDIMTVADCLKDVLNVFSRHNDYSVSGPVWEYFRANKTMKFEDVPPTINASLFKQETLINDAVDGLLRELLLDRANGFIGKTIIHPTHIPYVNGMLSVTKEVYDDALQVLGTSGGVIKSASGNKMNEIGPHRCWAEKIVMRAKAYGVIASEANYRDLFEV